MHRSLSMMLWVSLLGDALRTKARTEELMNFATNESHTLNRTFGLHIVDTVINFETTITNLRDVYQRRGMHVFNEFTLTQSIMQNLDTCVSFHHSLAQAVLKKGISFESYDVEDVPTREYVMDDLTDNWDKQGKDKTCGEDVLSDLNKLRGVVVKFNGQAEEQVDKLKTESVDVNSENPLLALDSAGVGDWFMTVATQASNGQNQDLTKISNLVKEKQLNGLAMAALADVKLREYFQITDGMVRTVRCMLDAKQGNTEGEECLAGVVCTYVQAATSKSSWAYEKSKYFYKGVKSLINCDVKNIALLVLDGLDFAMKKFTNLRLAVPENARQLFNFIRQQVEQYKTDEITVLDLVALAGTFNGDEGSAAVFSLATALAVSGLLKNVADAWSEGTCQAIRGKLINVNNGLDQMRNTSD